MVRAHRDQGPDRLPAADRQRRRRSGVRARRDDAEARRRRADAGQARRRCREHGGSMFAAIYDDALAAELAPRQHGALIEFGALINGLQAPRRARERGRLLSDLLSAIGYESYLFDTFDKAQAQARCGQRARFRRLAVDQRRDRRQEPARADADDCARSPCSSPRKATPPMRSACRRCTRPRASSFRTYSWSAWKRASCRIASRSPPAASTKSGA